MADYEERVEELLARDSFVRWIEGKASAKEASAWNAWLQSDPNRRKLVEESITIHNNIRFRPGNVPEVEVEAEHAKLSRSIDKFELLNKKRRGPTRFANRRTGYIGVAAVLALLLTVGAVVGFLYPGPEETTPLRLTTTTEYGQKKQLTLSDGSIIVLNANSSLTYPAKYTGGDLEVWLNGEAYFDIVHKTGEERRLFTVHTLDGKVEVLGTKFNVNTYKEVTQVVLEEGQVRVELTDTLNQIKATHIMEPGELSWFANRGKSIQVREVEPELYTSWTQNRLAFDQARLIAVAKRIEEIYGVRFSIADQKLQQTLISGSIPSNNLSLFLKALGKMLDRPVTNKNGTIFLGEATGGE